MTATDGRVTDKGEKTTGCGTGGCGTGPGTLSRWLLVLAPLAVVIAADQAAKWWAWRHVPGAHINPGGDFLTGRTVGGWYVEPVTGALLDLLDFGLVSVSVAVLARLRRPVGVTVCGSLMVGGWGSNLLDRLGMHYWTAPGSIRGAVDFINAGGHCYNLADFVIAGATPLFLLAASDLARCAAGRRASAATAAAGSWLRVQAPVVALTVAALTMTVALGAAHYGTLIRPLPTPGRHAASPPIHIITEHHWSRFSPSSYRPHQDQLPRLPAARAGGSGGGDHPRGTPRCC